MLSIIVALSENNLIGKNGKLPWYLPADLKYFKERTIGKNIIMGRKTFESLPFILPERKHIVLTNNLNYKIEDNRVEIVHEIGELQHYIEEKDENFVIGGAAIYKLLLPYVSKLYITKIHQIFEGDTYFPEVDFDEWNMVFDKKGITDGENPYDFDHLIYEKK